MKNILECAKLYEKLLNKDYVFTIENGFKFKLYFASDNFYHLLGLEKLTDIAQLHREKPNRIFRKILLEKIKVQDIQKSKYYHIIENRIDRFEYIIDLLNFDSSNKIIVDFDVNKLTFNTKLHNTKFVLYKHIENTYVHLTIGKKAILYPETFIVENGS